MGGAPAQLRRPWPGQFWAQDRAASAFLAEPGGQERRSWAQDRPCRGRCRGGVGAPSPRGCRAPTHQAAHRTN
eukprot:666138-Pyramimonas_sp.AAC.2